MARRHGAEHRREDDPRCTPFGRFLRQALTEVLSKDYVRTARAKGVVERWVVLRHALPNALLPVITLSGILMGLVLAGCGKTSGPEIVVEQEATRNATATAYTTRLPAGDAETQAILLAQTVYSATREENSTGALILCAQDEHLAQRLGVQPLAEGGERFDHLALSGERFRRGIRPLARYSAYIGLSTRGLQTGEFKITRFESFTSNDHPCEIA